MEYSTLFFLFFRFACPAGPVLSVFYAKYYNNMHYFVFFVSKIGKYAKI